MKILSIKTKVILVEPSGAINVGSIARLCENYGIDELRLVAPKFNPEDPIARQMALKGKHLLKSSSKFPTLLDAISDCKKVIGTCGRIDHGEIQLNQPEEAFEWLLKDTDEGPIAIVFGREDRGLTNKELELANKVMTLKTPSSYQSLNLSHAVAIVLHELHRQNNKMFSKELEPNNYKKRSANPLELNNCLKDAEDVLLEIGFLLKHTAQARMSKIKRLLHRADIKSEEVSMIRGIVRQVRWAINSKRT